MKKIKQKANKTVVVLMSLLMLITTASINIYAANGDLVRFEKRENASTEHDVNTTKNPGANQEVIQETIYCLQKDYVWPKNWTDYYEADVDYLLNQQQLDTLTKLMYVGYPYDVLGLLSPIYDAYGDTKWAKMFAADTTQYAISSLLEEWQIPGNTPRDGELFVPEMVEAYNRIINFVKDPNTTYPDPETVHNQTIEISGDSTFIKGADGNWSSGELKITEPAGFKLRFNFTVSEGIKVVDTDGNELTYITEDKGFKLVTSDPTLITSAANFEVTTDLSWPKEVAHYRTENVSIYGSQRIPFQTMLAMKIAKKTLTGGISPSTLEDLGSLTVEKAVDSQHLNAAKDEEFWFTATLTNSSQTSTDPMPSGWYSYTKTHADNSTSTGSIYLFNDGVFRFSLKAGEKIKIDGIPTRYNYEVLEYGLSENGTNLGNWTPTYVNQTGSITSASSAKVTNTYNYAPISVSFEGNKFVEGEGAHTISTYENRFKFILFGDVDGQPMPNGSDKNTSTNREEKVVSNDASGNINFGSITFDKVGEYNYTVYEEQVSEPNITKDMYHWRIKVIVDKDSADNTKLKADVTYEHHHDDTHNGTGVCEHSSLSFRNTFSHSEIDKDIHITKTVINNTDDLALSKEGFRFTIKPDMSKKANGMSDDNYLARFPSFDTNGSKETTVETGASGEAFSETLKFTESWFNQTDSDHDNQIKLDYVINEVIPTPVPKGWTYDSRTAKAEIVIKKVVESNVNNYTAEIKYYFAGDEANKSINPINFKNEYSAEGTLSLDIEKKFNPTNYQPSNGETYKFTIGDNFERNGDKTGYIINNGTDKTAELTYNSGSWSMSDNVIKFIKVGEYRFELEEVTNNNNVHMAYDTNDWIVDVIVTDNGQGDLVANAIYYHEHGSSTTHDKATFTNTYNAFVDASLDLSKTLLGRDWEEADKFEVAITHSELGNHSESSFDPLNHDNLERNHNNMDHDRVAAFTKDNQSLTLDKIRFNKEGVYYLVIKETHTAVFDGIVYDPTVYVVRYDVKKSGNDLVINSVKYFDATDEWSNRKEVSAIEFVNKYEMTELLVTKSVRGTGADKNKEFKFTVTLDDTTVNGTYGEMEFVNGVATFYLKDGEAKEADGFLPGTKYTVTENAAGYVSTSKNATGTLVGGIQSHASFINTKYSNPNKPDDSGIDNSVPPTEYKAPNTSVK